MSERLIAAAVIWAGMAVQNAIASKSYDDRLCTNNEMAVNAAGVVNRLTRELEKPIATQDKSEWVSSHDDYDYRWVVEWHGAQQRILSTRIAAWSEAVRADSDGNEYPGWCNDDGEHIPYGAAAVFSKPLAAFAKPEDARRNFMEFIKARHPQRQG